MFSSSLLAPALLLVAGAQAHMSIVFPPPFDAPTNPHAVIKNNDINSPITAAKFPCSGLHKTGGPSAATLTAGAESNITFSGSAVHGGGSCQVALSYDKTSFYVIHSWQGGCPVSGGSFPFTVPSDAPSGEAVFAWTWINNVGNREYYMNCGAVTIAAGSGPTPKIPFLSRPDLFVANLGNGCLTPDNTDTTYPNPGPDVTSAGPGNPLTNCQPVNGVGNSVRQGGGPPPPVVPLPSSAFASRPVTSNVTPLPSLTTVVSMSSSSVASKPATSAVVKPSSSAPAPSSAVTTQSSAVKQSSVTNTAPTPSNISPGSDNSLESSTDGTCGGTKKCKANFCCSAASFCGDSAIHCGAGCQPAFGMCANSVKARGSCKHA